jgi:hypothetical protein
LRKAKGKEILEAHQEPIWSLAMTVYSRRTQSNQPDKPEARGGVLGEMVENIQRVETTTTTTKADTELETADIGYGCLSVMFV